MPDFLITLGSLIGIGTILKFLLDRFVNWKKNNIDVIDTEKDNLREDVAYLRRQLELLRSEFDTLTIRISKLEKYEYLFPFAIETIDRVEGILHGESTNDEKVDGSKKVISTAKKYWEK